MGSYGGFSLHVGQILLVILIILILLVLASCVKIVPQAQAFIVERLGNVHRPCGKACEPQGAGS